MNEKGEFYRGSPPTYAFDNWSARALKIGTGGWAAFRFLFFGPDEDLYAVTESGNLIKGPPPTYASDNWTARATVVGDGGWQD